VANQLKESYRVSMAYDGLQALEILQSGHDFDVIVCDLNMPRLNGLELYLRLLRTAPEQAARFVFWSGGDATSAELLHVLNVEAPRISKPFDIATLIGAIEAVRSATTRPGNSAQHVAP
jgi:CheY-like chemotaxis protein